MKMLIRIFFHNIDLLKKSKSAKDLRRNIEKKKRTKGKEKKKKEEKKKKKKKKNVIQIIINLY